ncbi:MAG: naphthoate synthase, partial [Actinomycetota bacterium]
IFFLGQEYTAEEMFHMGAVNKVVDHADLETVALEWARIINGKSPTAQRMLKYSFNLIDDGLVGQQVLLGETTRLAYMTDEAAEGRDAFLEKRAPDWSPYPWRY